MRTTSAGPIPFTALRTRATRARSSPGRSGRTTSSWPAVTAAAALDVGHGRPVFVPLAPLVGHVPVDEAVAERLARELGALEEVGRLAQVLRERRRVGRRGVLALARQAVAALDAAQPGGQDQG